MIVADLFPAFYEKPVLEYFVGADKTAMIFKLLKVTKMPPKRLKGIFQFF